ncbi:Rpp14/Pop5 family protein [Methanofollis fontis]|uniref:Ribonuclease P protein component 2 n=1 Tax=Methanofollis fontis TaxID=2052832 RepID=A0A483CVX1_9EURY|nr:Rpp14/Pop5 family protein [Methanofollis fontis]TAJ43665.1 ribonuclease P [Methanofollis fontis]
MRPRPKALRWKRRYLLVRILPPWQEVDGKALYLAINEAVTSLFGDARAAEIGAAVVRSGDGHAIVRCVRGTEGDLGVACATVTAVGEHPVALRSVATSGTIAALRRRMEGSVHATSPHEERDENGRQMFRYGGHKIDVLQEGNKRQGIIFLSDYTGEEI